MYVDLQRTSTAIGLLIKPSGLGLTIFPERPHSQLISSY